jgi:kynureninase
VIRDESRAKEMDARDPVRAFRARFHLPEGPDAKPLIYFVGNSLGLQPKRAREIVERELDDWARLGVEGHFHARLPWYSYHERFRAPLGRLVGALPEEVVVMNGLTVNLHLLMATFYRPTQARHKILVEEHAFPSDAYAVQTQLLVRGFDPETGVIEARSRPGEETLRAEDLEEVLERRGREIALVLLGGVNYFTGQVLDMPRIVAAARRQGCFVGLDLAHAAGNVPLRLHDWDVDFAAWCSYKYLNAGPGAVAGAFVHERHARDTSLPRLGGWWGNDPGTRFRMHSETRFVPRPGADGWQMSNPPILAMAPLSASLELFDEAGFERLREKSVLLTGYLQGLIDAIPEGGVEMITPREPSGRGCQASLRVAHRPRAMFDALAAEGVQGDFREPDVIRVAPTPLYNTFHEVWRFAEVLARVAGFRGSVRA